METLKMKGEVTIRLLDNQGRIKEVRKINNLIVTAGKNYLADWLAAASQAGKFMSYIGIGAGTTAAAAGDTALESELTRKQGALSASNNIWTNTYTFAAGDGTGTVTEAGLLSASSSGTLFARTTFGAVTKGASDTLQITWNITLG